MCVCARTLKHTTLWFLLFSVLNFVSVPISSLDPVWNFLFGLRTVPPFCSSARVLGAPPSLPASKELGAAVLCSLCTTASQTAKRAVLWQGLSRLLTFPRAAGADVARRHNLPWLRLQRHALVLFLGPRWQTERLEGD